MVRLLLLVAVVALVGCGGATHQHQTSTPPLTRFAYPSDVRAALARVPGARVRITAEPRVPGFELVMLGTATGFGVSEPIGVFVSAFGSTAHYTRSLLRLVPGSRRADVTGNLNTLEIIPTGDPAHDSAAQKQRRVSLNEAISQAISEHALGITAGP